MRDQSHDSDLMEDDAGGEEIEPVPTRLPGINDSGDCGDPQVSLTGCEWITQHEIVVVGTIVDVRGFSAPALTNDRRLVSDCPPDDVGPGLELVVRVDAQVFGTPIQEDEISVRLGILGTASWSPRPLLGASDVRWTAGPADAELRRGMAVGFGLFQGEQEYTPGLSSLFGLDADGKTFFQPVIESCGAPPPSSLTGLTATELTGFAGACDPNSGQMARAIHESLVSNEPTYGDVAVCYR